jgi:fatty-acyl-CoA synthase
MSGMVIDALTWWARVTPNAVAVDFDGEAGSYRQLRRRAAGVAADLLAPACGPVTGCRWCS